MSISAYGVEFRDENKELRTEKAILMDYFNKVVRECRKITKGKTYDELESGDSYDRFQNRLGNFEHDLNNAIWQMNNKVTYKPHKEQLTNLYDEDCLYSWDYTENPMEDLNTYVKCLRKKLKSVIKIYEQHEFRDVELIRGYRHQKSY